MSYSKFQPTQYGPKGLEKQLLNFMFTGHDLICSCEEPQSHLTYLLIKNTNPTKFNKEEQQEIKQCLGITTGDKEEDVPDFDAGDLERLFGEDFGDETG